MGCAFILEGVLGLIWTSIVVLDLPGFWGGGFFECLGYLKGIWIRGN